MAHIYGTNKAETINAADGITNGDDTIYGLGGGDTIKGLGGDDDIIGGPGADLIDGGAGNDSAHYAASTAGISLNLHTGHGFGGEAEGDLLIGIETVFGSAHDDTVAGDDASNRLAGWFGNDTLKGGGGEDWLEGDLGNDLLMGGDHGDGLYGGADDDSLFGGDGDDLLCGNAGHDLLNGGRGRDSLLGGGGAEGIAGDGDTYQWSYANETGLTAAAADTIHGFDFAAGDRIDLGGIDANVYAAGNQAFTFIGQDTFSGTPGEINYYHLDGDTYIRLQTGTSADVEGVIRVSGIGTPEASWFVL